MNNKYDTLARKYRTKNLENNIELDNLLIEILHSSEIKKIAPIYGMVDRPEPLLYLGNKEHLEDMMKANFDESEREISQIRIEKIYLYLRSTNYDRLCIEKISEYYYGGHGSYKYLTIDENSNPQQIRQFAATLNHSHIIEGGFSYNKELKTLTDHKGNNIKDFNLQNLQICLDEYLIKPSIENEVFNHRNK